MAAESRLRRGVRRDARRVALCALAALVVVNVVVRITAPRWRAYDPVFYRDRVDACRSGEWDLVVAGGSPTMAGIDVTALAGVRWRGQQLGRCFNLGLPLATAAEVCLAVEHGVTRPPRLLLYGIAATDLNSSRLEAGGPRYLMSARDVARWVRTRPDAVPWGLWNYTAERFAGLWSLLYYREGIRLWAADRLGSRWPSLCPEAVARARLNLFYSAVLHSEHGVAATKPVPPSLRLDCFKAAGQPLPPFLFLDDYRLDGYLPYLQRLLDWGQQRNVPVLLVNLPASADLERLYPREFAAYRATLMQVSAARGVRVLWPTREEAGLSDADFADRIHLNADGMAKLSAWLRRAIEKL